MKVSTKLIIAGVGILVLAGGVLVAESKPSDQASEQPVQISAVPQAALIAAQRDLGVKVVQAKVMKQDGQTVYDLEGQSASDEARSVQVTANGKILSHETDDNDDD